ncbi:MAG TPA: NAD(P)/FAD-dependent oxidoreductase, partial [Nocardioides sp.]
KRRLPEDFDVDTHFRPHYNPWDQRLCVVPDADLFRALRRGDASIVTDRIATFTERGIALESGAELEADVVITATGLNMQMIGGVEVLVDGAPVPIPERMTYKAMMLEGVPNHVFCVGYTNASWTLKVDLVAEFTCRLLAHMAEHGYRRVVPRPDPAVGPVPLMDFTSGYVLRALDQLPHQGDREPWRLRQSYLRDRRTIRRSPLEDGVLDFA